MIDDEFDDDLSEDFNTGVEEDDLDAMGDQWLAANDPEKDSAPESVEAGSDDPLAEFGLGGDEEPSMLSLSTDGDEGAQLAWRETYYVLFPRADRPTLTQVEAAISDSGSGLVVENLQADDDGLFQSVLIQAPEDNAALEISFESGESVVEQSVELAKMIQDTIDGEQLAKLMHSDARLDVMHFERIESPSEMMDEDPDAMAMTAFDPATLIMVVEALAHLTGGLPVDPAAGELLI